MPRIHKSTTTTFAAFLKKYLIGGNYEYSWKVADRDWERLDTLGLGFNWRSYSDQKVANKDLKYHLSMKWGELDWNKKVKLATWIVENWGKIHGNKPKTIESHVRLVNQDEPVTPIKGVASYSKILAIKDPNRYAIYDARVAAALNAIQLLCAPIVPSFNKIHFPYLAGRNSIIEGTREKPGFVKIANKKKLLSMKFGVIRPQDTYGTYLSLLDGIAGSFEAVNILDVEMVLFSEAPSLCKQATKCLDVIPMHVD